MKILMKSLKNNFNMAWWIFISLRQGRINVWIIKNKRINDSTIVLEDFIYKSIAVKSILR